MPGPKSFVPTMEDFPQTLTAVRAPTLKHTVEVCQATSSKTETRSYQDRSTRPATTDFLCTTTSTEDSRKSAMWSRPKKSIASTGGGTRSDRHRSQRGNSSAEEGLNREKAPYPSSTKDDRGSSRCAQDPLRIEGCAKKGPFQDHGCFTSSRLW